MNVREIRLSVGRTINLGDFNSLRLDAGLTVAVSEGDDLHAIRQEMHQDLEHMIEEAWHADKRGAREG
jgi:hypothetical protein